MAAPKYQDRLSHPRRCTARRHSDGKPCGKFATKGASVCYVHGGWAPQVKRKALIRRMIALDVQAKAEAAFNVLLPPELHPLVSGGGRGNKKADKPEPAHELAQVTLDGIARINREQARGAPAIIATEPAAEPRPQPPLDRPVDRPSQPPNTMPRPNRVEAPPRVSASPTKPHRDKAVPRLMTMEEAAQPLKPPRPLSQPPRRHTRRP